SGKRERIIITNASFKATKIEAARYKPLADLETAKLSSAARLRPFRIRFLVGLQLNLEPITVVSITEPSKELIHVLSPMRCHSKRRIEFLQIMRRESGCGTTGGGFA